MASIQERLQRKREPLDKWSTREQLCLSFAVAKVGDQNWMSVSRSLKPFGEGRPGDWFHQKNCAAQYGALLENIDTPKRKKRSSGVEALESPSELILKKLIYERTAEMKQLMEEEKAEYKKLQDEMILLKSGALSEEQLDLMCKQIDEEEQQKENEAIAHAQWLKEREIRKAEIEKVWRPTVKIPPPLLPTGQKRKASDAIDQLIQDTDIETPTKLTPEPPAKPALSPLLTSLLKSPSHAQNVATSSILHSAITSNQRPIISTPTIASLLNSSTSVQVSPGIQQLVSTAIAQEPMQTTNQVKDPIVELLDGADTLPNLKVEDIENTILSVGDGDLPEIKNEEVDVIISDLIENADIVTDPETHLLDGDDIISNLESELEELDNKEKAEKAELEAEKQKQVAQKPPAEKTQSVKEPEIDPFEFQEDPEFETDQVVKLSNRSGSCVSTGATSVASPEVQDESPIAPEVSPETPEVLAETEEDSSSVTTEEAKKDEEVVDTPPPPTPVETPSESIEVVELVVMEDEDASKDAEKIPVEDIPPSTCSTSISSVKSDEEVVDVKVKDEPAEDVEVKEEIKEPAEVEEPEPIEEAEPEKEDVQSEPEKPDPAEVEETTSTDIEMKQEPPEEEPSSCRRDTFTPEYTEDIFDDKIEVTKLDKNGKAKRDYSRTKKKEETDFDILIAVNPNIEDEAESSEQDEIKKEVECTKQENEQSHSPWTEEEEQEAEQEQEQDITRPNTRRYSTPATPIDSVPNSPASSYFEDDRDYRSLKKSLMLVYSRLSNHKYASWFQKPITNDQAPGYHKLVKRPMDLNTIKKNIESGAIRSTAEFKRDVLLMFYNAIMYNKTDDTVYKMTVDIQQEAIEQIKMLQLAQADTPAPARRETRTSEGPGSKRKRDSESLQVQVKSKKRKED